MADTFSDTRHNTIQDRVTEQAPAKRRAIPERADIIAQKTEQPPLRSFFQSVANRIELVTKASVVCAIVAFGFSHNNDVGHEISGSELAPSSSLRPVARP